MKRKILIVLIIFLPFLLYGFITAVVTQTKINQELTIIDQTFCTNFYKNLNAQKLMIDFSQGKQIILDKYFSQFYRQEVIYPNESYLSELHKLFLYLKSTKSNSKKYALIISQTLKNQLSYEAQQLRLRFLDLAKGTNDKNFLSQISTLAEDFYRAIKMDLCHGIAFYQSNAPQQYINNNHNPLYALAYKLIGTQKRDFIYYLTSMKNCEEVYKLFIDNRDKELFMTHAKHFDAFLFRSANLVVPINQIRKILPEVQQILKLQSYANSQNNKNLF